MVNPTSPMVHPTGVLLFMIIITGRVSWGSCDPFPQLCYHNRPVFHVHQPGFSHTDFKFGHDRVEYLPAQVHMCCSVNDQPTGYPHTRPGLLRCS